MTDPETDARRLAELAGWEWVPANEADTTSIPWNDSYGIGVFRVLIQGTGSHEIDGFAETADREDLIYVPAADARLYAHLAFVVIVAEALATGPGQSHAMLGIDRRFSGWDDAGWCVTFRAATGAEVKAEAPDLSHAAIRAAIAALEARR